LEDRVRSGWHCFESTGACNAYKAVGTGWVAIATNVADRTRFYVQVSAGGGSYKFQVAY
jgi:hypothetical protein